MARYADSLLADGEAISFRTRQHWLATIIDGRYPWAIFLVSLVVLVLSTNLDGGVRTIVGYLVLLGFVVSLAWLAKVYWNWLSQDYLVTNRRVIKVEGIINKRSADSSLEKINDAVLEQNLIARMLNYGDLDILTAADVAVDRYRMLNRAPAFKRTMLNEKHELEGEFGRPFPAPPLRSGPPMPVAAPPATPVAAAPSPPPREMSADEVTRALASLADLRDRGAISPEEYEAKKADLLGRL
jgi:hypothetical protein